MRKWRMLMKWSIGWWLALIDAWQMIYLTTLKEGTFLMRVPFKQN